MRFSPLTYILGLPHDGMRDNLTHYVHLERELKLLLGIDILTFYLVIMLHFSSFLFHS